MARTNLYIIWHNVYNKRKRWSGNVVARISEVLTGEN